MQVGLHVFALLALIVSLFSIAFGCIQGIYQLYKALTTMIDPELEQKPVISTALVTIAPDSNCVHDKDDTETATFENLGTMIEIVMPQDWKSPLIDADEHESPDDTAENAVIPVLATVDEGAEAKNDQSVPLLQPPTRAESGERTIDREEEILSEVRVKAGMKTLTSSENTDIAEPMRAELEKTQKKAPQLDAGKQPTLSSGKSTDVAPKHLSGEFAMSQRALPQLPKPSVPLSTSPIASPGVSITSSEPQRVANARIHRSDDGNASDSDIIDENGAVNTYSRTRETASSASPSRKRKIISGDEGFPDSIRQDTTSPLLPPHKTLQNTQQKRPTNSETDTFLRNVSFMPKANVVSSQNAGSVNKRAKYGSQNGATAGKTGNFRKADLPEEFREAWKSKSRVVWLDTDGNVKQGVE